MKPADDGARHLHRHWREASSKKTTAIPGLERPLEGRFRHRIGERRLKAAFMRAQRWHNRTLPLTNMAAIDVVRPLSDYRHQTGHDHHKASGPRERLSFGQPLISHKPNQNIRMGKCILTHISSSQREGHSCAAV
jgi:hypothetical protein